MKKKYDFCATVGRFQVADLHYAHIKIIYDMLNTHKKVLLLLGVSQVRGTNKDPLDFESRKAMIQKQLPNVIVEPIQDQSCDLLWSQYLDQKIEETFPKSSVLLYGGRDSFLKYYVGKYDTKEFPKVNHWTGTTVREKIGSTVKDSSDWREGQIYLTQNQFPRLFNTVDIAVVKGFETGNYEVLLAKKEGETLNRFIGGFVDPTDKSLEVACRREVQEEADIEVDDFTYISSTLIDDWRYRKSPDGIMTTFFMGTYIYGSVFKALDDICELDWFPIDTKTEKLVQKGHRKLFKNLRRYIKLINKSKTVESIEVISRR